MKKKTFQMVFVLLVFTLALYLSVHWYDWKLFIILILFGWGMNLENKVR